MFAGMTTRAERKRLREVAQNLGRRTSLRKDKVPRKVVIEISLSFPPRSRHLKRFMFIVKSPLPR